MFQESHSSSLIVLTHLGSACAQPEVTILHLGGSVSSCRGTQMRMHISQGRARTRSPITTLVFLSVFPHPLVNHCLNWPAGTHGRCRRLNLFSYKQEMGDTEMFLCLGGPYRVLLDFREQCAGSTYGVPCWTEPARPAIGSLSEMIKHYSLNKPSGWDVESCFGFPRDVEDKQWTLVGCPQKMGGLLRWPVVQLAAPPVCPSY